MPLPSQLHIDAALSDFAVGYGQEPSVFIGQVIAPPLNVSKMSDVYWIGGKESYQTHKTGFKRPAGADFVRVGLSHSTSSYLIEGYGVEVPVLAEEIANADAVFSPEQEGTRLAVDLLQLAAERRIAAIAQSGSVFTQTSALSGTNMFDNPNSDPIGTIMTGKGVVEAALGLTPNTIIMGRSVFNALRNHPDFIERVKYTQVGTMLNEALMATFFDVNRVVVGRGLYDTADEGQTATMADIWGKNVILAYIDTRTGPMREKVVTPMRTFVWAASPGNGRFGVSQYYEPQRLANIIQCTDYVDEATIEPKTVYLWTTVVA